LAEDEPVHIVIPMAVIDELDRLKKASKKETRWRARYSTAVLDRVCLIRLELGSFAGKVTNLAGDASPSR
jgi:predicted ribonuclease YlaK